MPGQGAPWTGEKVRAGDKVSFSSSPPYSTWPVEEETDVDQQRGWLPGDREGSQNLPHPRVGAQRHGAERGWAGS